MGNFFEAIKVRLNFMRKTFAIFLSQTVVGEGGGQNWIRTSEGVSQRIYSPPRLATSVSTLFVLRLAYLVGEA